jgi:outer membrane protein OmpA-like peptidoglycan-associated protein
MARFCTKCGTPGDEGTKFCQKCGNLLDPVAAPVPAAAEPSPAPATAGSSAPLAPSPVMATGGGAPVAPSQSARGSGGCGKVVVIVLVVVGLLVAAGIGGAAYLAYRAKKKVDEIRQAAKSNDLNKMAEALGGKHVEERPLEGMPTFPDWSAAAPGALQPGSAGLDATGDGKSMGLVVPLRKGLTVVTAIQESFGDYESYKEIKNITDDAVSMEYRAEVPDAQNPFDSQKQSGPPRMRHITGPRRILRADLANAHEYAQTFSDVLPETIAGTTALGISAAALNDLKSRGETPFTYQKGGLLGGLGGLLGGLSGMADPGSAGKKNKTGDKDPVADLQNMSKTNCTLKRTDQKTYAFPVLMNDQRVQLPAIRANCKSEDEDAEFYFLDDAQNPLSLTWKLGDNERLQVIKIILPATTQAASGNNAGGGGESAGVRQLEQKLQEQQKVQIYGIYFDFASAQIKPESKPTLDEIAEVMKLHPDWKLNVAGHTDNVGGDAFNLELSKKRSAAVKDALISQYKVAPGRLITSGYGASSPVETNETMEGRARNRRVELSKE